MTDNKKSMRPRKTKVVCFKCGNRREEKDTVLCSICNKRYDLDCIGLSEKLYAIMKPENKSKLKCILCAQTSKLAKPGTSASTSNSREVSNVTKKKKKKTPTTPNESVITKEILALNSQDTVMCDSYELLDDGISEKSETERLSKSVDYTTLDLCDINELNEQIADLKTNLVTTQNELENTIIENNDLKRQIIKLSKEIKVLKEVCQASTSANIPNFATLTNTPLRKNQSRRSISYSPRSATSTPHIKDEITTAMQRKICDLKEQLRNAKEQIKMLHSQIIELEDKLLNTSFGERKKESEMNLINSSQENLDHGKTAVKEHFAKGNLTIISAFQSKKAINTISKQFGDNFNYCHYCKPGAGIVELFSNIEEKLKNFTKSDCCIICIGEADFQESGDNKGLVHYILEAIKNIYLLTNIIICAPSYICGSTLYNCRVENFNNLLFSEMHTCGFGTLYDTNLNLSLKMFSDKSGKLNNYGLNFVIFELSELTSQLLKYTSCKSLSDVTKSDNNCLHVEGSKLSHVPSLEKEEPSIETVNKVQKHKTTLLDYFLPVRNPDHTQCLKKFFR